MQPCPQIFVTIDFVSILAIFPYFSWHESSGEGQGWTDFVWSWHESSGAGTNRLELDDWADLTWPLGNCKKCLLLVPFDGFSLRLDWFNGILPWIKWVQLTFYWLILTFSRITWCFKYNRLREGHFTAISWHESSAGEVQGWTDFVWSWKIGSGLARIVWSWKIGPGMARIVCSWTIGIFGSSAISLPKKIRFGQACTRAWESTFHT